ncbi:hypothetical protein NXV14_05780 [Bacteroides fragilis]|nr:hypothetical protein [Bacteroides fragilis]
MEAIKRLNALSEEYLGGLRLETINTGEATAAVKDYTDNLLSMARDTLGKLKAGGDPERKKGTGGTT